MCNNKTKRIYQSSISQQLEEIIVGKSKRLDGEATSALLTQIPDLFLPGAYRCLNQSSCSKAYGEPTGILSQQRYAGAISKYSQVYKRQWRQQWPEELSVLEILLQILAHMLCFQWDLPLTYFIYLLFIIMNLFGCAGSYLQHAGCFSSVQSLTFWLFVTPWTAAHWASLSITNSQSLLRLMSVLILCHPLLLPSSVFPIIRFFFSKESVLPIRWPKY